MDVDVSAIAIAVVGGAVAITLAWMNIRQTRYEAARKETEVQRLAAEQRKEDERKAELVAAEAQRKIDKAETDGRLDVIHAAANSALTAANTAKEAAEKVTQEGVRAAAAKDEAHAKEIAGMAAQIELLKHSRTNGAPSDAQPVVPAMAKLTNPAAAAPVAVEVVNPAPVPVKETP